MTGSDSITAGMTRRPAPRGGQDRPIDQWLRRSLSHSFDRVLTENLPESWLNMIDQNRNSGRGD
jgi:hypothetical protein